MYVLITTELFYNLGLNLFYYINNYKYTVEPLISNLGLSDSSG